LLDVHPPHHAAHSWRDFFIHIATIVFGLLIAIGLEQSVELFHHRHEVSETREALRQERELNIKAFAADTAVFRADAAQQKNDLLVLTYLKAHPGTAEGDLPGTLVYISPFEPFNESAWTTAQQTGVTQLMPRGEVAETADLVKDLDTSDAIVHALYGDMVHADGYRYTDPNLSHLTPEQIDKQIELTGACLERTFDWGSMLYAIQDNHPDFRPGPTFQELMALENYPRAAEEQKQIAPAAQRTHERLATLNAAAAAGVKAADDATEAAAHRLLQ
jgi:hypothetical protein